MGNKYFNAKRDRELIATGTHFFCHACLVAKPASEQSPDERYCQWCYDFLLKEAEMDTRRRDAGWKPIKRDKKPITESEKVAQVLGDVRTIMATLNTEKTTVAIIQPSVRSKPRSKRGPKFKELPRELIIQWASEGLGSKAIATRLKRQGVEVGFRTIARVLAGERKISSYKTKQG